MKIKPNHVIDCDLLVVGGGLGGCVAAITARELGVPRVVLVDKGKVGRSGQSVFAAGIWALNLPGEDIADWIEESIVTGDYLNDQHWVRLLWQRNYEVICAVEKWCAQSGREAFKKTAGGDFLRRRSRGHIKTWHGLVNSLSLMEGLRLKAIDAGVEIIDRVMVTDLVCPGGPCTGAVGVNYRTGETFWFKAGQTVLASAGALFKSIHVGHRNLTGDMLAAFWRAGGTVQNMEMITHNTTARPFDVHGINQYQSVGGKWVNSLGEEFMPDYDPVLKNRCNQPTMCLSLAREVHEGRGPIMFDVTAASAEDRDLCRQTLPESFRIWDMAGIDPFREKVEWVTAFYGTSNNGGGIRIGLDCATGIANLYACGDLTPVPPHGGYCFGGVNLAFTAVSGRVAGESAAGNPGGGSPSAGAGAAGSKAADLLAHTFGPLGGGQLSADGLILQIQKEIFPYRVSLIKSRSALENCLGRLREIKQQTAGLGAGDLHQLVKANECKNLAAIAELMVLASLYRRESRGFHFREDYPLVDNENWLKWVLIKQGGSGPLIWTEDVPTPYVRPHLPYYRHRSLRHNVSPATGADQQCL